MGARADATLGTKARIVDTATELFLERAFEDVTLAAIAGAAGVSHQTVLNHFDSKEGVALAVAEELGRTTADARSRAEPGDCVGAVHALVGEYERIGDANARWAVTSERLGSLAPLLDGARASHQDWLRRMFGLRLPAAPAERRRAVNALHAATDVYTWKLLRRDLGLGRRETEATIVQLVEAILDATTREGTA